MKRSDDFNNHYIKNRLVELVNVDDNLGSVVVVVVVLVAVTVVVTMVVGVVVVDGEVLLQKLLQTLELLLAVVVVLVVLVTVGMSVVVVVMMVVVVLVAMVLVEESLDLIDEALIDQKLEGLPVLVVLDGTLQSAVEVQLKAEPDLLTFQLVLKLVEELTVVVAVVVVVVTVVAVVVLVAMSVEVVVVVAVMVMGVDGDISIDFSHLGNSDVGLVGSAVVSMVVVMAVMMGMMNRGRGIIDVVTEVEDVGRLVGEFSVGGSRNDGGSEAEEGDGDDLGLHCGSCSLDRELES
jgi:hypothetical protein